ncbi:tRNA ligase subunit PheS family protein [Roseivivax sediminis]|uniref:Phenylalanyl-tRNA synthetase, alpha subunit n=1 Tax=Roseivivax sediminis TaxID=936889 RepID=A0A1I1W918_9RHOB|nr:phenylalanine--tRNA ligase subunit alpha [Roseivivax sediminis]SFD90898.1 phenylalanyl-tRNA synthetase, alpha subunit [Roseivivax sediminis]
MDDLRDTLLPRIAAAADEAALDALRAEALGKQGSVSLKMRELGRMTPEERKVEGPRLNALKDEINAALAARRQVLADEALEVRMAAERIDVTLPARPLARGTVHPLSQVIEEVTALLADQGFALTESDAPDAGPGALPDAHVTGPVLRALASRGGVGRVAATGRVRASGAPHPAHVLYGVATVSAPGLPQLKWLVEKILSAFLERGDLEIRLRAASASHTAPSAAFELRGADGTWTAAVTGGLLHPVHHEAAGLGSGQAIAFALDLDRLAMLKYGIPDAAGLYAADIHWLRHYGFDPLDVPTLAAGLSR